MRSKPIMADRYIGGRYSGGLGGGERDDQGNHVTIQEFSRAMVPRLFDSLGGCWYSETVICVSHMFLVNFGTALLNFHVRAQIHLF